MKCRACSADTVLTLVDLGCAPPSNAYLGAADLKAPEKYFPLRVRVCPECWLAQTEDFAGAEELFRDDYAYYSSFSESWLAHCRRYVADMSERYGLGPHSLIVEVAANDGYLLQFARQAGIPCLGVEPTAGTAAAARRRGIPVIEEFFGRGLAARLAAEGRQADLMIANNVLAHVPDINDFVAGFALLLKPRGVATFEFPHLACLIAGNQFDTIYHEHFSYLSLHAVERIFAANGLLVFDVEELPTHGGSLRVHAARADGGGHRRRPAVDALLAREREEGVASRGYYAGFQQRSEAVKDAFLAFLLAAKREGRAVAGYGAAAKGNTLINYAGIRADLLPFVADRNPAKQGKYLPGSRIPVVDEGRLRERRPDYVVILPWNLQSEVMEQLAYVRDWGGRFVTAVPALQIHA